MELTGKYLTFFAAEEFGVKVLCVREIMGMQEICAAPNLPEWTKGVINLRGKVIPVADLRWKLNFCLQDPTQRTCIVIAQVALSIIGFIVDSVNEVITFAESDVSAVDGIEPEGVVGVGNTKPTQERKISRLVKLLDLEAVFTAEDREMLAVA
jgi:purine-binding chemotaxis protein CheW